MACQNFPRCRQSGNLSDLRVGGDCVSTRVKICGITRDEDAQAAVELGADALGFVFVASSPRLVSAEQAALLIEHLPPFVLSVGLFMDNDAAFVQQILDSVPLMLLQFHGDESPAFCASFGRPYIKAVPMGGGIDPVDYAGRYTGASGFLLDSHGLGQSGGSGETFDWSKVPHLDKPIIVAGGLTPDNIKQAVVTLKPYAVDVSSGVEAAKGIKDRHKMAAFIQGVREGDRTI